MGRLGKSVWSWLLTHGPREGRQAPRPHRNALLASERASPPADPPLLQAASNLASIGVASMLLGSPPPAAAPMHSPLHAPYMAAPMAMPAGAMGLPMMGSPHEYGMMQGMAAAAMAQHQAAASYDAAAAAGFGMSMGAGAEAGMQMAGMPMPVPMHGTPPPQRYAGSRLGPGAYSGGTQRSGGYRGTPGSGRMSRFAPPDAVAAF